MTDTNNFNIGDVVRLKSGGPKMTINRIVPDIGGIAKRLHCSWFTGNGTHGTGEFHPGAVVATDSTPLSWMDNL